MLFIQSMGVFASIKQRFSAKPPEAGPSIAFVAELIKRREERLLAMQELEKTDPTDEQLIIEKRVLSNLQAIHAELLAERQPAPAN